MNINEKEFKYLRSHIGEEHITNEGYKAKIIDGGSKKNYCTIEIKNWVTEVKYDCLKKGNVKRRGTLDTKICTKCGIEKKINEFSPNGKVNKDGIRALISRCKSCEKECKKEYYENNKDKMKKKKQEYQLKNKDKMKEYYKEYSREYRLNNKDKIRERNKKYRLNNINKMKEKEREYRLNNINKMKEYYENNKEKIKEYKKEHYKNNREYYNEQKKEHRNYLKSKELELLNKEFQSFVIDNPKYYNKKAEVWTYIIKSDGFYKIGITNNFMRRMKEINKCILIYEVYRLPIDIERRLHLELEDYRFSYDEKFDGYTELFYITDEIANEIIKIEHFKKVKKEFKSGDL